MSSVEPRRFTAKNGSEFTIRTAQPADALPLVEFLQAIGREAEFILTQADEFSCDPREQRKWIRTHLDAPGQIALLAEEPGGLIGCLSFESGNRWRNAHQGSVGLSVRQPWWGQGVGTAMLGAFLDWAEASPFIEKVCLGVFHDNRPAIALYKKFGFVEEGRQPRQIKMAPGLYQDVILMHRFVC